MRLQHIISTMNRKEYSFLESMNLIRDVLVVNQVDVEAEESFMQDKNSVRIISTKERGLSNSRNMLLDNAEGEISILGDDDLYYLDGYDKIIERAYQQYPNADIIVFRFTQDLEKETRIQFRKAKKIGLLGIGKVASVEITFKTKEIRAKGIRFDRLLGLGAEFGSGEENAFLADALRAGLTIQYIPETICYLMPDTEERQKWKDGFNKDYFVKKGACFYRIYKGFFFPLSIAFILLKKRSLFKAVSFLDAFTWMKQGKKEYKQKQKEGICF